MLQIHENDDGLVEGKKKKIRTAFLWSMSSSPVFGNPKNSLHYLLENFTWKVHLLIFWLLWPRKLYSHLFLNLALHDYWYWLRPFLLKSWKVSVFVYADLSSKLRKWIRLYINVPTEWHPSKRSERERELAEENR